ncbi:MAG: L-glutamate gamma-semialdehyde dehydrogenase [Cytophagales bacterium]|nr:L-glutamate gamma-semialdehyde dehydrogenase [Cytophagales bacterium]
MPKGHYFIPDPINEPILSYAPGTPERDELLAKYKEMYAQEIDAPMYIGADFVRTGKTIKMTCPHDHQHVLGQFHEGDASHAQMAIETALAARDQWASMSWQHRASVFLKAADLLAGPYRSKINAATMLGQGKNALQAEIDAACEFIDFLRYNVSFMQDLYMQQPESADGIWNRTEYRPLEGFVFAITPFNFTAIAGNLPAAPAMMGNVVVWKPSYTQVYSAQIIMEVFKEAGLPDGVINLIYVDGPVAGEVVFNHQEFAGLHFTGSTGVFQHLWKTIGKNVEKYRSYPRIVGETGGKDFVIAHRSAKAKEVATGLVRGSFEYQGQKCSASSRAYIPSNLWEDVKKYVVADLKEITMGSPEDFSNFVNAVIDERSFNKITSYIDEAKNASGVELIAGGNYDNSKGWFIEPTVFLVKDPMYRTMCEEIFGPVLTVFVYDENKYEETLDMVDNTSPYALTGAVFSTDRYAAELAVRKLVNAAGNFYINDKPTGAVVGQQPFGGARGSGTNDKAGSMMNLLRWVSARTIKETFLSATDYKYPFLG